MMIKTLARYLQEISGAVIGGAVIACVRASESLNRCSGDQMRVMSFPPGS